MITALLVILGLGAVILGLVGIEELTRWWERRHQDRLQVDPEVEHYMRRRSDLVKRAQEEADGRHMKPS